MERTLQVLDYAILVINGKDTNVSSISGKALRVYQGSNLVGVIVNEGTFSTSVEQYLPIDGSKVETKIGDGVQYIVSDKPASLPEQN